MKAFERAVLLAVCLSAAVLILTARVAGANSVIDLLWWFWHR